EAGGDIDRRHPLQPLPGRHAVDLEDEEPAVGGADQVDAGIEGAHRLRGGRSEPGELALGRYRKGYPALADIGDPALAAPAHGGHGLALDHEDPDILEAGLAADMGQPDMGQPDIELKVMDPRQLLRL